MPNGLQGISREAPRALLWRPSSLQGLHQGPQPHTLTAAGKPSYHPNCHEKGSLLPSDLFSVHLFTSQCTEKASPPCVSLRSLGFGGSVSWPSALLSSLFCLLRFLCLLESAYLGRVYVMVNAYFRREVPSRSD